MEEKKETKWKSQKTTNEFPIYVGEGILAQIKNLNYPKTIVTKESVFNISMDMFKEFYEEYPYAAEWDYEGFLREIIDYDD